MKEFKVVIFIVAISILLTFNISSTAFSAKALPDLSVQSINGLPANVLRGGSFSITDSIANNGNKLSKAFTVRYYLSLDTIKSKKDILLTGKRQVKSLNYQITSSYAVNLTVPKKTPLNQYYLLACADDTKKIKESNEKNNCIASQTTINVTSQALVISDLLVSPTSTSVGDGGGIITANFTLNFYSLDGDVTTFRFTSSDGIDLTLPIDKPAGLTSGTITSSLSVSTLSAKVYPFEIWIIDSKGNSSNKLNGIFTVALFLDDTNGTYSYDSNTDVLTIDLLSSRLTNCVIRFETGIFTVTNVNYHPTMKCYPIQMTLVDNVYGQINCYRIVYSPILCGLDNQGNVIPSEDYSGTWQCSDNNSNTYEVDLYKNGNVDISGNIMQCDS